MTFDVANRTIGRRNWIAWVGVTRIWITRIRIARIIAGARRGTMIGIARIGISVVSVIPMVAIVPISSVVALVAVITLVAMVALIAMITLAALISLAPMIVVAWVTGAVVSWAVAARAWIVIARLPTVIA